MSEVLKALRLTADEVRRITFPNQPKPPTAEQLEQLPMKAQIILGKNIIGPRICKQKFRSHRWRFDGLCYRCGERKQI